MIDNDRYLFLSLYIVAIAEKSVTYYAQMI